MRMLIFVKIVFIVFLLAVNTYGFILVKNLKDGETEASCQHASSKLLICALLGGALAIYVAMFIFKYRLDSLVLMVFVPVLIAVNIFFAYLLFRANFGFSIQPNAMVTLLGLINYGCGF